MANTHRTANVRVTSRTTMVNLYMRSVFTDKWHGENHIVINFDMINPHWCIHTRHNISVTRNYKAFIFSQSDMFRLVNKPLSGLHINLSNKNCFYNC
jgi:predicted metalloprotease with PDZ domain